MEAKTMKISIQSLDKIVENSSSSGHKHGGLNETLEKIHKPLSFKNRVWRGEDLCIHHCHWCI